MYSITDSSVVLQRLVGDFSSLCTTEIDLSITRLFVSKKSKHTLISPHGIGYSVCSSLTPSLLRLSRTVLVDTYHWSVHSVFIRRVRFIWSCVS